ncbi:hypothetical protein, partial [Klebsiella pneumoniae]|uniref:hypothetical protein n=1 Tax=Klebsiella pneumoniae TaxID=573 RepID=UPI003969774A
VHREGLEYGDEDDEKSDKSISKHIPNSDEVINDTESKPEDGDFGHEKVDDLPDSGETSAGEPLASLVWHGRQGRY